MRSQLAKRVLASLLSAVLAFSTFLTPEALAADALSDNGNVVLRDGSFTAEIDAKLPIVKLYSVSGNTLPAVSYTHLDVYKRQPMFYLS